MARAFAIATERGLTVMSHAEDMEVSPWDYRLAENLETLRNCHWPSTTAPGCTCATSPRGRPSIWCASPAAAARSSPAKSRRTICGLTTSGLQYRVNPPIRTADDVKALVDAIKDAPSAASAPTTPPTRPRTRRKARAGMVGLETAFAVCYTKLCRMEGLPLEMLSFLMSSGPRRCSASTTARACWPPATTPTSRWSTSTTCIRSRPPNCTPRAKTAPYDGEHLYGRVVTTIKQGRITYRSEQ